MRSCFGKAAGSRLAVAVLALALAGCADTKGDPMQTVRDSLFYDGLAAFHEGYYKEASIRWERAAHFGDGEAARNLGHLYRQGLGVDQDAAIAVAWYQIAADAGVVSAQYNLGMLYMSGGAPNLAPNPSVGMYWLNKAAAAGLPPAKAELERLAAAASEPKPEPVATPVVAMPVVAAPDPAPAPAFVDTPETARAQVGSYRSRKDAEADWKRVRKPGLEPEIIEVNMGERGRWYRLLAVGTPDAVEAYCDYAAKQKVGCWPGRSRQP
ncbi:SPOR domain-containing protein [Paramagnetospirillum kuznetsovii]|nr:SPOR domain-containing protein [Paramagnetospirillum kuznetsovii]